MGAQSRGTGGLPGGRVIFLQTRRGVWVVLVKNSGEVKVEEWCKGIPGWGNSMCKGLEERDWPGHRTESWLEPKLWLMMGSRQGLIHTGPPQQLQSLGLILRKMGSGASAFCLLFCLFLAVLGLHCCTGFSQIVTSRGYSQSSRCCRAQAPDHRLSSCGTQT